VTIADHRVLQGSTPTIGVEWRDQEGDPIEPTGTVTVHVVDLAGADVVAAGTATVTPTESPTARTVALPRVAELDLLTATWSEVDGATWTTTIEVVGGFYAGIQAVRASDATLADEEKYPAWEIVRARRAVEDEFERIIGHALVPRIARYTEAGARHSVVLPHLEVRDVRTLTIAGATAAPLAVHHGAGVITIGTGGDLDVIYTQGFDRPTAEALEAFYLRVRDVLNRSKRGVADRTTTFTSELGGTYSLAVAGRGGSLTGIPDVDVVLRGLARKTPGMA
jgi:hypothetical protein